MKQILFFCCCLALFGSCTSPEHEIYSSPPSKEFVGFCSEVVAKTWSSDTSRLVSKNLYSELQYKSINWVDGQPFYPVLLKDTRVKHFFTSRGQTEGYEVFDQVKAIWGYFYYKQNPDGMFPDGVIEEWQFDTEQEANKALEQFHEIDTEIFFNTQPYACTIENRFYIFHTRAMAFSYNQKPIFLEFVKRNKAKR